MKSIKLSDRQREFLASYVPDICHGENSWLSSAGKDKFVEFVSKMDFDGQVVKSDVRVAKNLETKGMFRTLDVHSDIAGQPCIYVEFSAAGAGAVFDLMTSN